MNWAYLRTLIGIRVEYEKSEQHDLFTVEIEYFLAPRQAALMMPLKHCYKNEVPEYNC